MAKKPCERCGKEVSTDLLFGVRLCDECRGLHSSIVRGEDEALDTMRQLGFFSSATLQAQNLFKNAAARHGVVKEAIEKRKVEQEQYDNLLLTTGNSFDGYVVEQYIDVICEDVVLKNSLGDRISAGLDDFANAFAFDQTELTGTNTLIANARTYVKNIFKRSAVAIGANAVLGVDFETSFGSSVARIAISGTAVRVRKLDK